MLPDDALRATLRNFSTLFLVLFVVIGPLHLLYGFAFQDVLALRELHPAISEFPPSRQVRGVGRDALASAGMWLWVLAVIELALLPVFVRVVDQVRAADEAGDIPTALRAWRRLRTRSEGASATRTRQPVAIASGVVLGIAVAFLTEATLMVTADLVPDEAAFGVIALARSAGHCAGGAFALGTFVFAARGPAEKPAEEVPDLY